MFSRNLKKVVKYGIYGGVAIGSAAVGLNLKENDYNSFAIVRITRTAVTAVEIGRMYRSMLYTKDWDTESEEYIALRSEAHRLGAEKLLELCKINKGAYIKVGQHVGALDHLLPNEYVTTMRVLHKDAPQNTLEELFMVVREDLHKEPDELFDDFEPKPLGTASLAQVHRAKLKDGTDVAVKIQHHFVRDNFNMDMRWMELCIISLSKIFPEFEMQWLIDETKTNITKELNFFEEGKNAEKVAEMFKDFSWLKVPKIFWNYCSERVLVMEYLEGGVVNDIKYIEENKIDKLDVCRKLGTLYSQMIFVRGFVHSDPHPGNILLCQKPGEKEVSIMLLDHGLYASLTDKFRFHYSKLWMSIMSRNRDEMMYHAQELGIRKELYPLFACIVTGRPWDSIMSGIDRTKRTSKEKALFQKELPNIMRYITECLQHVDRQALLVLKTNDLIRSIEFALGTHNQMTGFLVMSKCCLQSVYLIEQKDTNSIVKKNYLKLRYRWSLLLLYCYSVYLNLLNKLSDRILSIGPI